MLNKQFFSLSLSLSSMFYTRHIACRIFSAKTPQNIYICLFCVCVCVYVFFFRFKYDYMVLDEGHSIKNIKSSRFQRLRMVTSKHRLLLR